MEAGTTHRETRWQSRQAAAGILRALIFAVPILAGFLVGGAVASVLPGPSTAYEIAFWWIAIVSVATVTATAVDRIARQLLPLTVLLRMTMLFPDAAPSRLRMARRAGNVTELKRRIHEAEADPANVRLGEVAELILSLSTALSNHDRRTRGHSERTRMYTDLIAEEMGLPAVDRDRLRWAALLHDVGKLEVPTEILNKDSSLDEAEWNLVKEHPIHGMRIVAPLIPWLGSWAETIEHHHERFDGSGYPHGLAGGEIALGARIVSVADAFDVMTSGRSYQTAMTPADARGEIIRMAGVQFDPVVARALMNVSLGRLRWTAGPLAALAQIPFVRGVPQIGRDIAVVMTTSAIVATGLASGVIPMAEGTRATPTEVVEVLIAGDSIRSAGSQSSGRDTSGFPLAAGSPASASSSTGLEGPAVASVLADTATPDDGHPVTNEPPIVADMSATAPAGETTIILLGFSDPDGDVLTCRLTTSPSAGSAVVTPDCVLVFSAPDSPGSVVTLGVRVSDGIFAPTSTVAITIVDPPVHPDSGEEVAGPGSATGDGVGADLESESSGRDDPVNQEDEGVGAPAPSGEVIARGDRVSVRPGGTVNFSPLANDSGPADPSTLTVTQPNQGTTSVLGSSGRLRYTAPPDFTGTVTFSYSVCSPSGSCASAVVTVEVS
jgi:putative nucleotidyltransferase with HDIG domain